MKDKIPLPLNYEDAKQIIVHLYHNVDMAFDYGDAFIFTSKKYADSISDYGWAIRKDDAKVLPMGQYLYTRNTNASPKSIPF